MSLRGGEGWVPWGVTARPRCLWRGRGSPGNVAHSMTARMPCGRPSRSDISPRPRCRTDDRKSVGCRSYRLASGRGGGRMSTVVPDVPDVPDFRSNAGAGVDPCARRGGSGLISGGTLTPLGCLTPWVVPPWVRKNPCGRSVPQLSTPTRFDFWMFANVRGCREPRNYAGVVRRWTR